MTWVAFVKSAYKAAREWGMQPTEFWQLSPCEWWWEFDTKIEISRNVKSSIENSKPGPGGFSKAEWDVARAKHKARVNDAATSSQHSDHGRQL